MPFERGSPDKNHSWDLMRSSWPGSSDPSQTAAAAQRHEHRRGQVPGLARRAALRRTHPAGPRPAGRAGSRTHLGDARTGKLRTAVGQNERRDVEGHGDGDGVSSEMRISKTKER